MTKGPTPLLPPPPLTVDMIQYDFEEYALEHGIPETLDPLPYRKTGSVFATGEEAEPVLTSAKHGKYFKRVATIVSTCILTTTQFVSSFVDIHRSSSPNCRLPALAT